MAKLHELLALGDSRRQDAENAKKTILGKLGLKNIFMGRNVKYQSFNEDETAMLGEELNEKMATTVMAVIEEGMLPIVRNIDVEISKDLTNTSASADLKFGEFEIKDVPATTLLWLEKELNTWLTLFISIPVLDIGTTWVEESTSGKGVFKNADPEIRFRTKKEVKHKVLYEATAQHPAQIERWQEDVRIGKLIENKWCGMLPEKQKNEIIRKTKDLIEVVKEARARANCQEVKQARIGELIAKHILG